MPIRKVVSDDFTSQGRCNFYVGSQNFIATSFALMYFLFFLSLSDSPYMGQLNQWIMLVLQMHGMQERWIGQLMPNATKCARLENSGVEGKEVAHARALRAVACIPHVDHGIGVRVALVRR
jgi:hypothetical protein